MRRVRLRPEQPGVAVNGDALPFTRLPHVVAQPDDGRNTQRAGQNGAVGRGAAQFGADGQHPPRVEPRGVGRGQIGGDEDRRLGEVERRRLHAHQPLQDAPAHILDVGGASLHVFVVHIRVGGGQRGRFPLPGPLGVDRLVEDPVARGLQRRRVFQNEQMGLEDGGLAGADLVHGSPVERFNLDPRGGDGLLQPLPFGGRRIHMVGNHIGQTRPVERRGTDSHAGRGGDAF